MSRPVSAGLLAVVAAATLGLSPVVAQSPHSVPIAGAVPLHSVVAPGLPDPSGPVQSQPREAGPDRTRGALWGGGIGLLAGGLLGGLTAGSGEDGGFGDSLTESAAVGEAVVLGAVVGAAIGALLGATVFAPSRRSADGGGGALSLSVHPSGSAIAVTGRLRVSPLQVSR